MVGPRACRLLLTQCILDSPPPATVLAAGKPVTALQSVKLGGNIVVQVGAQQRHAASAAAG